MADAKYTQDESEYIKLVGERLRSIRRQQKLSLQEVESHTGDEFKASVLGAYERGERSISVPRLQKLAEYYNVPVDQLLPQRGSKPLKEIDLTTAEETASVAYKIDLERLADLEPTKNEMLTRYLRMIQVQRQDFNGRVLTIRDDDLRAVACILGVEIEDAADTLVDLRLIAS